MLPPGTLAFTTSDAKVYHPPVELKTARERIRRLSSPFGELDTDLGINLFWDRVPCVVIGVSDYHDRSGFDYLTVMTPVGIRVVHEAELDETSSHDGESLGPGVI